MRKTLLKIWILLFSTSFKLCKTFLIKKFYILGFFSFLFIFLPLGVQAKRVVHVYIYSLGFEEQIQDTEELALQSPAIRPYFLIDLIDRNSKKIIKSDTFKPASNPPNDLKFEVKESVESIDLEIRVSLLKNSLNAQDLQAGSLANYIILPTMDLRRRGGVFQKFEDQDLSFEQYARKFQSCQALVKAKRNRDSMVATGACESFLNPQNYIISWSQELKN